MRSSRGRVVVLALLMAGASSARAQDAPEPPAAFTAPPRAAAEVLSAGSAAAEPLEATFERFIPALLSEFAVEGAAVGVLRDGRVVYARGFGFADKQSQRAMTSATLCNVASVSKVVTAWGLLRLAEWHGLDLDEPVEPLLSRWHLPPSGFDHGGVTCRRILSHTAGLSPGSGPGFFHTQELPTLERVLQGMRPEGTRVPSPEEILSGKINGPAGVRVVAEPGSVWQYSNGGFRLLQLVVEEVSGSRFSEFMRMEILGPLGMKNSSFDDPLTLTGKGSVAAPYDWRGAAIPMERVVGVAATGLLSNVDDLLRLAVAEVGTPDSDLPLTAESIELMRTPVPAAESYGLGHVLRQADGVRLSGHTGLGMGWNALFMTAPERQAAIVVLTNSDNGYYVHETLLATWFHLEFGGHLQEEWVAPKKRIRRLAAYVEWLGESGTLSPQEDAALLESVRSLAEAAQRRDSRESRAHAASFLRQIDRFVANGQLPKVRGEELSRHTEAIVGWLQHM